MDTPRAETRGGDDSSPDFEWVSTSYTDELISLAIGHWHRLIQPYTLLRDGGLEHTRGTQRRCERPSTQAQRTMEDGTRLLRFLRLGKDHGFLSGICERSVTARRAVRLGGDAATTCYGGTEGDADVVDGAASA